MSLFPYKQSFAGSTVPPDWKLYGSARMTGEGWLSLTQARTFQAGTALLNVAFPSSDGISVQFDLAAYGSGDPADGLSFFLIDGAHETGVGGPGGALGYACYRKGQGDKQPGVSHGYVGIGVDQHGSFSNPTQAGDTGPGTRPDNVVLRGSGDGYDGYRYLVGAALPTLSLERANPTRVLLSITDRKVSVSVRKDNNWQRLIDDYDLRTATGQAPLPGTLKLGLSAATGALTNNYEVRDLEVTLPAEFPLAMTGPQSLQAGSRIDYRITVENKGPNAVPDAKVTGKLPTEVTAPAFGTLELSGGATAGAGTITDGTFTQPLNLPVGGKAVIPLNGTVKTGTTGSITCDATVTSETRANIATKYSDSVTTTVTAPPTAEVPLGMRGPATADSGKPISYTMTVENKGPNAVPAAKITGTLAAQITGARFETPQLSGGATAGQGTVSGTDFTQPLNLPRGGKAVIRVTGTIEQNFTGDLTSTSKIETPDITNTSPDKTGSVTTKVTPPKIDVTIKSKNGFEQSWPEEYKGYVWSYTFTLAASRNRVQQWQLSFDGLPAGSRFNPAYKDHWYTVVKDGGADGHVIIESPATGHSIEPNTPLDVQVQVLHHSLAESNEGLVYNLQGIALKEGAS
ncbi:DUF11 domain-containing protein [Streptomyces griseocarneus]|uniref:DUF11 domain-containing protein n=1 Tax=Streptomyces griseocarneus TaxID=51201 RepID=UPI00167D312A|nr:DUF11 domain-containing protein [Streptomyces griseocarneus]MBZ6476163.1 DUF11 domain-containing protein [Streptomyces griseocarneus]GHG63639.1 hypothetical protein GCM10018779_33420 [Streptomyces griseocarneus]